MHFFPFVVLYIYTTIFDFYERIILNLSIITKSNIYFIVFYSKFYRFFTSSPNEPKMDLLFFFFFFLSMKKKKNNQLKFLHKLFLIHMLILKSYSKETELSFFKSLPLALLRVGIIELPYD